MNQDTATHQLNQLHADGQTQTSAAVLARRAGVSLGKRLKQAMDDLVAHAHTVVDDTQVDTGLAIGKWAVLHPQGDQSGAVNFGAGELDGVTY